MECLAHQLLTDRVALGVVGVEQGLGRPVPEHGGELPPEVDGVLETDADALGAERGVVVGGVAGEEDAALAVLGGQAGGVGQGAHPGGGGAVDVLAGHALPGVGELRELQLALAVVRADAGLVDDDAVHTRLQGDGQHHAAALDALADGPHAHVRADDVGQVHAAGGHVAGEVDVGQDAHGGLAAVAADDVRAGGLGVPVGALEAEDHAVLGLGQGDQA